MIALTRALSVPLCPGCGGPAPTGHTYCRLSCRTRHEQQRAAERDRLPLLDAHSPTNERPGDDEIAEARRRREAIGRLYGRRA